MDRLKSLKNLYNYICLNPDKVQIDFSKLFVCALAGRVCYSKEIDYDDRRLNLEIITYLDKLSKWTHYSVFSHLPVSVKISPDKFLETETYNLFKSYYDKQNEVLYLNLRHMLEAFNTIEKGTLSYVLDFFEYRGTVYPLKHFINVQDYKIGDFVDYYKIKINNLTYDVFLLKNIDRATSHQIVRHQSLNFNQQSQRYVKMKAIDMIPSLRFKEMYTKINSLDLNQLDRYNLFCYYISSLRQSHETYEHLLNYLPSEMARGVLPNDTSTNLLVSGFRTDVNKFLKDRLSSQAQSTIREIAKLMQQYIV